jgi:hypothetical protein
MKIQSSVISLNGSRTYLREAEEKKSLRTWVGTERPDFENIGDPLRQKTPPTVTTDLVDLSRQAKNARETGSGAKADESQWSLGGKEGLKILLIERFIQELTGKKIKIRLPEGAQTTSTSGASESMASSQQFNRTSQSAGWGAEYDYRKTEHESEQTRFSASGVVETTEGRRIDFAFEMTMSRDFTTERNATFRAGDALKVDPLVISFTGEAATLADARFGFDLDSDGTEENIPFLAPGSGFLSLDTNGNDAIDNGSELFGPATGSGFGELSNLDEDGNGWIDENDSAFTRLRIWTRDSEGADALASLAEKGIGAIYLGRVSTLFDINGEDNVSLGSVKESGVYLSEDGSAGAIQEIDLTV